jgi:hypothetical protein
MSLSETIHHLNTVPTHKIKDIFYGCQYDQVGRTCGMNGREEEHV